MAHLHLPHPHADEHPALRALGHALWAACAGVVVLYIVLASLEAIDPAVEVTVLVIALSAACLAHAWRGLFRDDERA